MGYDCTFHLVDENAIRDEFVPKLLGESNSLTPLDEIRDDADELWDDARRAIEKGVNAEGEPISDDEVASFICQLAVIYSSCSLPHHYERELAFSIWPDDEVGQFPAEFAHSPEPLFSEIVAQFPRLKDKFPDWFQGNCSTGVYVPAKFVPRVRQWLEEQLEPLTKGDKRMYRGLLAVLKSAEERNLAFWEATDLAIPMMDEVPGDPELLTADFLRNVPGAAKTAETIELPGQGHRSRVGGNAELAVISAAIPDTTIVVDFSRWPPIFHMREQEFAWNVDCDRNNLWLFVSRYGVGNQVNPVRGRVRRDPRNEEAEFVFRVEQHGKEVVVNDGFLVGGRAVLIPDPKSVTAGTLIDAWIQEGNEMIPAPGLPPHEAKEGRYGNEWISRGVARLADGSEVLIWDGNGYEWNGTRFVQTFDVGLTDAYEDFSAVPSGDDGFFFVRERRLWSIHRDFVAVQCGSDSWEKVMEVMPGPSGGILISQGGNPDGDIGKLFFPAESTYIHIEPELFGDQDLYDFLCWSPTTNRFIASDFYNLYSLPEETVLNLPRCSI